MLQQRQERLRRGYECGVVPRDRVLSQFPQAIHITARGIEFEGSDADVACRHAGKHCAGQNAFAVHRLARRCDCEGAGGGDAKRVHGLADQHLAKHGADGGLAVAAAAEWRAARALERDVATTTLPVDHLAEKQCAAITELRREPAELVARVGLSQGFGAGRQLVSGERRCPRSAIERRDVEA